MFFTDCIKYSLVFILAVVYASFFEWCLHKFMMHKPLNLGPFGKFSYPFETHALTHHGKFKADQRYFLTDNIGQREKDKHTIPMAWWNGPVLIAVGILPCLLISCLCGDWWILVISAITFGLYYWAYERMHWCMHLPKAEKRIIERFPLFRYLNGHHLLHHRYMGNNYNVVFPLIDLILGTLMIRAPKPFNQARGHSVPDVQPR